MVRYASARQRNHLHIAFAFLSLLPHFPGCCCVAGRCKTCRDDRRRRAHRRSHHRKPRMRPRKRFFRHVRRPTRTHFQVFPLTIRDTYCSCSAPLHYSSSHFGHVDASRFLVECKADVAARDRCSPLAVALLVQRLLFPPLSHSLRCSSGRTPLKIAIDNNNSDVVAYLRSIGAPT